MRVIIWIYENRHADIQFYARIFSNIQIRKIIRIRDRFDILCLSDIH